MSKVNIISSCSGRALDAPKRGNISTWQYHNQKNQRWVLEEEQKGEGSYFIVAEDGCVLDVINESTEEGAELCLWAKHVPTRPHQLWKIQECAQKPGHFQIISLASGMSLSLLGSSFGDYNKPICIRPSLCVDLPFVFASSPPPPSSSSSSSSPSSLTEEQLAQLWRITPSPAKLFPYFSQHESAQHTVPFDDLPAAFEVMKREGFVVITNVLTQESLLEANRSFGRDLLGCCDIDAATEPSTHATVRELMDKLLGARMEEVARLWPRGPFSPNHSGVAQGECAWRVRLDERVKAVFEYFHKDDHNEATLGPEAINVGMDMVFFAPNGTPNSDQTQLWPHSDQNAYLDECASWKVYQGVVSLWPSLDEESATTVIWPRSHQRVHHVLMQAPFVDEFYHHYVELTALTDRSLATRKGHEFATNDRMRVGELIHEQFVKEARRVVLPAGSLLLWDSKTIHQGWRGGQRLAIPVCWEPSCRRTPEALRRKMIMAALGCPSTHWASLGNQHNVSARTITEGKKAIVDRGACVHLPIKQGGLLPSPRKLAAATASSGGGGGEEGAVEGGEGGEGGGGGGEVGGGGVETQIARFRWATLKEAVTAVDAKDAADKLLACKDARGEKETEAEERLRSLLDPRVFDAL